MTVEELTELRKNDWCIDEILKGIAVREDVIQRTAEATYLTDARKAEYADEMNAEKAHGYAQIENMLRNPLPFREASEKPEPDRRYLETNDGRLVLNTLDELESEARWLHHARRANVTGWLYESDILALFTAWKEGKAA